MAQLPPTHLPIQAVVEAILMRIREEGELTDETLRALHVIFPHTLCHALEYLDDSQKVQRVTASPSGRWYFQVQGRTPTPYVCLGNYCSCPSFLFTVMNPHAPHTELVCKHQLATWLAEALGKYTTLATDDDAMARRLMEAFGDR